MAWRDSRHSRRRLLLYLSSTVMGVAALVSVRSFGEDLLRTVEDQAKELLGADLALRSGTPFQPEAEELFKELGGDQVRQTTLTSMAFFPGPQGARLVTVRALSGPFPFYGTLETLPAEAAGAYLDGPLALVDHTLLLQFGVEVGEEVRLGDASFRIAGRLLAIPGESAAAAEFAPKIYIPAEYLPQTGLIQPGSRVRYSIYFRFPAGRDVEALVKTLEPRFKSLDLRWDTVEERKTEYRRELGNLARFLSLIGFVAVILGGIGVASSIHLHIRLRRDTVAVLRCIGVHPAEALAVYVVQAACMGLLGALAGVGVGLILQRLVPAVLAGLLPFDVEVGLSLRAAIEGLAIGLFSSLLFASIPLARVRRISPLVALRADYEAARLHRDGFVLALGFLLLAGLAVFALTYASTWQIGLGFFGGVVVVFSALYGVARGIMALARRLPRAGWRYEWRQGLANLYRPHNQTAVVLLAVGLGTFFVVTVYLTQEGLLREVSVLGSEDRPNLVLFDIQPEQLDGVKALLGEAGLPIRQSVPVVTMRLQRINDQDTRALADRDEPGRSRWALVREYRSTYRDELTDAETLIKGTLQPRPGGLPPVSLEAGIAEELQVDVGDRLTFDVQGVPLEVEVGSLREVEWRNFQPNFFVVFPPGLLEDAPQFHVIVTRTESREAVASLQRRLAWDYPNVSSIDLTQVLATVDSILSRLSFVIRFMGLFSIVTGVLVMTAAIVSGRFQRLRESVLLRTLGALRLQVYRILSLEHLFLGLFSALTGLLLALVASWAVTTFVFDGEFMPDPAVVGVALVLVTGLTVAVGVFNSRGILSRPPLQVLRGDE
jgi:putative ABC transport system permease protein